MTFKNKDWDGSEDTSNWDLVCEECGQTFAKHGTTNQECPEVTPLQTQVGGDHYKSLKIQPVEYIHANGIPFIEGNVIKYVTRWRAKNGVKDLEKARHFIDLLIELENANG